MAERTAAFSALPVRLAKGGRPPRKRHCRPGQRAETRRKSPLMAVGSAPEPWLNRVVAFRSHQVRPARGAWDAHNSDTSPQPGEAIGSENKSPVAHSRDRILF